MSYDKGANSGVTGLVALANSPKFYAKVYGFARELQAQVENFPGRGDSEWGDPRFVSAGGTLLVRGIVQPGIGYPMPTTFKGISGTITLQISKDASGNAITETVSVIVISQKIRRDDGEQRGDQLGAASDNWHVSLMCMIKATPTEAHFNGSQPTYTDPTYSDKKLYEGLSKVYDPNLIADQATDTWLIWPVTDSDAAEVTELTTFIGAASDPMSRSLKLRPPTATRFNFKAVKVSATWARTDTKDDVINPLNYSVTDSAGANNSGLATDLNATPSDPAITHTVARGTKVSKINDAVTQTSVEYGKQSPKEDLEFEHDRTTHDNARLLQNVTTIAQWYLTASGTPTTPPGGAPAGLKKRFEHDIPAGHDAQVHIWEYAQKDVLDDLQLEKTQTDTDPQDLNTIKFTVSALFTTGAPPSPDPTQSGLKLTNKIDTPVTAADTSNQSIRVYRWAKNDSKDDLEQASTWVYQPAGSDIGRRSQTGALDNAFPTVPSGFVARGTRHQTVKTGHVLYTAEGGTRTTADDEEMPGRSIKTDPDNLAPEGADPQVYLKTDSAPTTVANFTLADFPNSKVVGSKIRPLDQKYNIADVLIGANTPVEEIERLQSLTRTDPTHIKQSARVVTVDSSVTTPANPDATNLSLVWCDSHQQNDTQYVNAAEYGVFTPAEEVIEEIQRLVEDINTKPMADGGVKAVINQSATPGSAPSYSGFVATIVSTRRIAKLQYLHWWVYRFRSIEAAMVAEKTRTKIDESGLENTATTAEFWTGGEPTLPTLAGFVLRDHEDLTTPNPTYTLRVYYWGLLTHQQEKEYEGTSAERDPLAGYTRETTTILDYGDTAAALADFVDTALKNTDVTYRGVVTKLLAPAKAIKTVRTQDAVHLLYGGGRHTEFDRIRATPFLTSPNGGFGKPDILVLLDVRGFVPPGFVGFYQVYLADQEVRRNRGTYILRSAYLSNLGNTGDIMYESKVNSVNSAAFMGFAAHRLLYAGANLQLKLDGIDGTQPTTKRLTIVDRVLQYDSLEWFSATNVVIGESALPSLLVGQISNGKILGSILKSSLVADWPAATTFTEFLT